MASSSEDDPSSRLAKAAQELLEASGVEVSSKRQKQISSDLLAFKASTDAKLNTLNQSINSLSQSLNSSKENFDEKINTVNQRITNLEKTASDLKAELVNHSKMQALASALDHFELNSFQYYNYEKTSYGYGQQSNSKELIPQIILSFRRGYGYYLPEATIDGQYKPERGQDDESFVKGKTNFETKLVNQIHSLTGTKPRVETESGGKRRIIYFS